MASKLEDIEKRIANLSNLTAEARRALAQLGENDDPHTELRIANLQSTITTVERQLALARRSLQGAHDLDAAAQALTKLQEGRLAAQSGTARAHRALDRTIASDAIKAILTSVSTRAKKRTPK